ncbi:MAG: hypothetical protein ABSE42_18230 [Bryobacteraceae bacterium]
MNRLDRASLLLALTEKLRTSGSWAGETHVQKATYILETVLEVPAGFEFILYKHGPFSFDLRDEIGTLRTDGFLGWEVKSERYGPSLKAGPLGDALKQQFPSMPEKYESEIDFVTSRLGHKNVAELERLATAIYVTLNERAPADRRAPRINELKRHVSLPEAEAAVEDADRLISEAKAEFANVMTA